MCAIPPPQTVTERKHRKRRRGYLVNKDDLGFGFEFQTRDRIWNVDVRLRNSGRSQFEIVMEYCG